MSKRDNLNEALIDAERALDKAQRALDDFEPDDDEAHERYDEYMQEVYGDIEVCGIRMDALDVLKHMDPVAYRTGFNDWMDGEDKSTFDGYSDLEDAVTEAQDEVDRIQNEIDESEDEEG